MFITGPFIRRVTTVPLREINELRFEWSWAGRILGYGTFTLYPVRDGCKMPDMNYIPYPDLLYIEIADLLFSGEDDN
jgi:hypothetical protein